jgi:hypothetical protein
MRTIKLLVACLLILLVTFSLNGIALGQQPEYISYLPMVISPPGSCSAAPTLISPTNGSNPNTLIPTFQWDNGDVTEVTEVNFLLTLHENDFPVDWVLWLTSYDSNFNEQQYKSKNLIPATTYYWQVWLKCGETESPHSEVWSFTTGVGGTILPAPELIFPANEELIYASMLPITLQWSPVTGATEYKVVISRYDGGDWLVTWSAFVNEPYYTIPFNLYQNTWYKWAISPINDYAIGSSSSRIFETSW